MLLVIFAQKIVNFGQTAGVARVGKRNTTTVRKQNNYEQKYVKSTYFGPNRVLQVTHTFKIRNVFFKGAHTFKIRNVFFKGAQTSLFFKTDAAWQSKT